MPKYMSMPVYRPMRDEKNPRISARADYFVKGFRPMTLTLSPRLFGKLFLESSCNTWENLSLDSLEKGAATC